jgi:hypothetical protein
MDDHLLQSAAARLDSGSGNELAKEHMDLAKHTFSSDSHRIGGIGIAEVLRCLPAVVVKITSNCWKTT